MSDAYSDIAKQTERALEIFRANLSPDSAKKHQTFRENMKRLHGEIERMVYAAEIACKDAHGDEFRCPLRSECSFHAALKPNRPYGCMVAGFRDVIGDHSEQHDCMRECPR